MSRRMTVPQPADVIVFADDLARIVYVVGDRDYLVEVDGQLIGYARREMAARDLAANRIYDMLRQERRACPELALSSAAAILRGAATSVNVAQFVRAPTGARIIIVDGYEIAQLAVSRWHRPLGDHAWRFGTPPRHAHARKVAA